MCLLPIDWCRVIFVSVSHAIGGEVPRRRKYLFNGSAASPTFLGESWAGLVPSRLQANPLCARVGTGLLTNWDCFLVALALLIVMK